ncbi:uncharacterized protein [Elaeis guineensis]|uniref:Uncharacterized protein LOC105052722 n=1 Tax=Elaeis guineensis var. tenera TaxID=51953 RepID=A0A6J0PN68_ELAGV|nr:uncharacterized protein LOC105052722 [Elaeis guineensis]XP_019708699.1 uncharacterized protein LOC105052722 [Elaeis guineensis]XP_029122679.1 uncharacterized protein LOC105052722 [Elaeis guineensis]
MQALKAGWVGQTFALARRDDFGEKKPRRRRTKEERRAMVESFIKKYRTSNSGKFPSLNLTHKEVGGSFYIVREIVRDIIQENKVLGPGDASLKALNLEAGLEEHASGSTDPGVYLSISSMTHVADHDGMEMSSMANEHQSEESYELVKSDDQEIFASHANDVSVAEVWHDKSSDHLQYSNGPSPYDILFNAQNKEENLQKPSGSMHDNTGIHEQNDPVPQGSLENCGIHKIEQSHPFNQSVSITSPTKGLMLDGKDVEKKSRGVAEATDIFAESNVIPTLTGTDVLPEATISVDFVNSNVSDQLVDQLDSGAKDIFPTATSSINSCDLDLSPLETKELINSQEVSGMQKSEVEVPFMPGNKVPNINSIKSAGTNTSSSVNKEETVLTSMISQTLVSPASETSSTEALPVLQPNDMENMAMKTESASSVSLSPSAMEISDSECSTKHENIASNIDRGSNCSSKSSGKANKELETAEVNPVWATIKAFIDAVIKFWTE